MSQDLAREIVALRRMQRQLDRLDVVRGLTMAIAGLVNLTIGVMNIEAAVAENDAVNLTIGMFNLGVAIFAALVVRRVIIAGHERRQMMRQLEAQLPEGG